MQSRCRARTIAAPARPPGAPLPSPDRSPHVRRFHDPADPVQRPVRDGDHTDYSHTGPPHELRVAPDHPARRSWLPDRVRVPVVGHHTATPLRPGRRYGAMSYSSYRSRSRLRADRTPADLGTVDPQHVPRIRRQAKRYPRRKILDVEHPTKLCPRELSGRKIRTNTRRIDHELRNIRRHPVTAPPHTREIGSRHIRT